MGMTRAADYQVLLEEFSQMNTPRVLLEHYLKQLRLPTIVRDFPKLAEQCAKEGATFEQFLLRLVEQEI
jgi:hypothetical protein